jgi:hypothetical protein
MGVALASVPKSSCSASQTPRRFVAQIAGSDSVLDVEGVAEGSVQLDPDFEVELADAL